MLRIQYATILKSSMFCTDACYVLYILKKANDHVRINLLYIENE